MFNKKIKEYKERQAEINEEIQRYTNADENYYLTANTVLNLAQRAYEIFQSSEVTEKRQLLNFLLQNLQLKGRKLTFTLKTPFDTVLKANKCSTLLPLLNTFRTIDWKKVKEEIEPFRVMIEQMQRLLPVNT